MPGYVAVTRTYAELLWYDTESANVTASAQSAAALHLQQIASFAVESRHYLLPVCLHVIDWVGLKHTRAVHILNKQVGEETLTNNTNCSVNLSPER